MKKKLLFMTTSLMMLSAISIGAVTTASAQTPCEHEYVDNIINPTCIEQGYTEHKCSLCGHEYKDNYIDAKGHDFKVIIVKPTCTEQGFTTHYCKTCGYQYSDNYVDPLGHNYTDVVFEPTCTEEGYTIHKCENCKHEYKDNYVPATGHEYEEVVTEATCGKGGYTTYTCKHCGDSYIGNETPAKGHNHVEKTVKATCVSYGYTEYVCECGDRYVKNYVKPLGHDYKTVIVPATKEETGYTKHICKTCGHTYLSDFVDSGDGGYIEDPAEPPAHIHNYVLKTTVDRLNKIITLDFNCPCGEKGNDLLTVLFTDSNDLITEEKPVNGVVDYKKYNGNYLVSVIDTKGNVLKSFNIYEDENIVSPDIPHIPDTPDIPVTPDEHIHNFILNTELNDDTGVLKIDYNCKECSENQLNNLMVIVTDSNGNARVYEPDEKGEIDLSQITGEFTISISNNKGDVLKEIKGNNKIETDKPDVPDTPDTETEPTEQRNGSTRTILIIITVLLIAGAVTVVILMKKKGKNKITK